MKKLLAALIGLLSVVGLQAQTASTQTGSGASVSEIATDTPLYRVSENPLPSLDEELSIQDCVRIALQNSPDMVRARLAVQSAEVALSSAKSALLPTASATVTTEAESSKFLGVGRTSGDRAQSSIEAGLNISGITDIGRTIRSQKMEVERAQLSLCETENAVVSSVKSAYYGLLAAQRAVVICTQSRDLYQEQYDRTKAFYAQGLRPKVDVTTAEVDLNNSILSLIRAKNLVKTHNATLANIMGVTHDKEFHLSGEIELEDMPASFEQALTQAYENRPDVRSSKTAITISEIKLAQSKAAYWPTFTLGASFSKNGDEFRFEEEQTRLFAGVEIPIFSALKVHNSVKQAKINLEMAKNSDRSLANNVFLEVQNAFVKLNEAAESVPVAISNVEKAKENMELAQGRYNAGVGDMISLKDAQVAYTDSELSLLTARYDYAVALAELKKAMGAK